MLLLPKVITCDGLCGDLSNIVICDVICDVIIGVISTDCVQISVILKVKSC